MTNQLNGAFLDKFLGNFILLSLLLLFYRPFICVSLEGIRFAIRRLHQTRELSNIRESEENVSKS